jgi:tRNA A-37 threonylcarbamoyl transferase component Bud32
MHGANIAHLDLTADNVVITADGPGLRGFDDAVGS